MNFGQANPNTSSNVFKSLCVCMREVREVRFKM